MINALPLEDIWTWQVLLTPSCGLEEDAKPLPVQSILRCKCNVFNAVRKRPNSSSHYLTGFFFCSLQRQTDGGGGGWEAQLGWRENKRAGAVFMVFLHPAKKRWKLFSSCNPQNHVNIWAVCVCVCVCLYGCAWDHKKEGLYVVVWLPYLFPVT